MATHEQKEEYYRYGEGRANWTFKEPDVLPDDVTALMKHERVDDRYRFVWMGVAVVRDAEKLTPNPVVMGDRAACVFTQYQVGYKQSPNIITAQALWEPHIVDWLMPKSLFVRVKQTAFWYWLDAQGKIHQANRPDELVAPPGVVIKPQNVLVELGHLVWQLQTKLTAHQLVDGCYYSPADAPSEYWHTLKTFRNSWNHGYLQPTVEDVDSMILKREHENRHLSPGEMRELIKATALAEHYRYLEAKNASERKAKQQFDQQAEDIIRFNASQANNAGTMPYNLPADLPPIGRTL